MSSRRQNAVQLASTVLTRTGILGRVLQRPATHFVYLHHVPDLAWFQRTLHELTQTFELISFSDAITRATTGTHARPALCLSFDDGFVSSGTAAELARTEFGITSALYVCTGLVGATEHETAEFFGAPQPELPMDWDAVHDYAGSGHIIGSHTISHANLAAASRTQLQDEVEQSRSLLVDKLGACDHFAWPYGRAQHFSAAAYLAARTAGYTTIASAVRGSHLADAPGDILLRHVAYTDGDASSLRTHLALGVMGLDGRRDERKELLGFTERST